MWFLRRILRVSYKEHKTNDQVLCDVNASRKLFNKLKQRQCSLIEHVMLCKRMKYLVTTGKNQGKRDKCRQKRPNSRWHLQMAGCKRQQKHIQGYS